MTTTLTLPEFAERMRRHDWTACMSDSGAVLRSAQARFLKLSDLADTTPNHRRVFDLAKTWHQNFTWSRPSDHCSEEKRFEDGWRWVGAYLWANGVQVSDEGAQEFVEPMGTESPYGGGLITGFPKWADIDAAITAAS
jgi:hypothetical protein